jgi:hypothetical protein
MPHVFTLEGPDLSAMPTFSYPPAGSPLAPSQSIVGPTRVATMVFGPGGTPVMYRRRFPARGPVCDYCDPNYFTVADGGQQVIPFQRQQFGDATDFLDKQTPLVAGLMILGGALATGIVLAAGGVWLYRRSGEPKRATDAMDSDW